MTSNHDPYACPICLAIGRAVEGFPPVIRIVFGTIGIFTGVMISGRPLAIFVGAVAGVVAAEVIGAAMLYGVHIWLRRRIAELDDPSRLNEPRRRVSCGSGDAPWAASHPKASPPCRRR